MRPGRDQQSLSYALRLPDVIQADALCLLDASREVINHAVTALWDRLDEFTTRTNTYAYKQVEEMIAPPQMHGHRQWRCEAEQAGRMLGGAKIGKLFERCWRSCVMPRRMEGTPLNCKA